VGQSCGMHPITQGIELPSVLQVPMSRLEPEEFINDRYKAIEERLAVGGSPLKFPLVVVLIPVCLGGEEEAEQATDSGREGRFVVWENSTGEHRVTMNLWCRWCMATWTSRRRRRLFVARAT
jgi:hypothetical protein